MILIFGNYNFFTSFMLKQDCVVNADDALLEKSRILWPEKVEKS